MGEVSCFSKGAGFVYVRGAVDAHSWYCSLREVTVSVFLLSPLKAGHFGLVLIFIIIAFQDPCI